VDEARAEALAAAKARASERALELERYSSDVDALKAKAKESAKLELAIDEHAAENARLADAIARAAEAARAS
jgi:hypothetical protein